MNKKHNEFTESLRNTMRTEDNKRVELQINRDVNYDEGTQRLQEVLEAKSNELFGMIDDNGG